MPSPSWRVLLRDEDLNTTGEVNDWSSLRCVPRFNDVGSWQLTIPNADLWGFSHIKRTLGLTPGVVIERDGVAIMSGPARAIERSSGTEGDSVIVNGVDDMVWLARRKIYPDPNNGPVNRESRRDFQEGPVETLLRYFVARNVGPTALDTQQNRRRIPGLVLAPNQHRGSTISVRPKFHNLLNRMQVWSLHDDLGFKLLQIGEQLVFSVYETSDRSDKVIFSKQFGNLNGFEFMEVAPEANAVIMGGAGAGLKQLMVHRRDDESIDRYGRIETFEERTDIDNLDELRQAADEVLAEKAAFLEAKVSPRETAALRFQRDYDLGDRVTFRLDGVDFVDVLREMDITVGESGTIVSPGVGSESLRAEPSAAQDEATSASLQSSLPTVERNFTLDPESIDRFTG